MDSFIRLLPKTELHVHLEATPDLAMVTKLAQQHNFSKQYLQLVKDYLERGYDNIWDFFNSWKMVNQLIQSAADLELVTYDYLNRLAKQNTLYTELSVHIFSQLFKGISVTDTLIAIKNAQDAAEKDFGIVSRTLVTLGREMNAEYNKWMIDEIVKVKNSNLVGIDISGNEIGLPNKNYVDVFKYAELKRLKRVAHAGEGAGTESVWSAVQDMKVNRIGHGINAVEDEELLEYMKLSGIAVELCLSSNLQLGFVKSLTKHPGRELLDAGIPVILNTDDPLQFNTDLSNEYKLAAEAWNLTQEDLIQITRNGIIYSLADDDTKNDLIEEFEAQVEELNYDYSDSEMLSLGV